MIASMLATFFYYLFILANILASMLATFFYSKNEKIFYMLVY